MLTRSAALTALLALTACIDPANHTPQAGWETQQSRPVAHSVYQAAVVGVSDGDTIRVTDLHGQKHKIRMAYIDAPELQQAHGEASRKALAALLEGQSVEVAVFERDRYRREVAQVKLNGRDVNLIQLENGHAWHYVSIARKKQRKADYQAYGSAESSARSERRGLWHAKKPQAPWEFRHEQRQNAQ